MFASKTVSAPKVLLATADGRYVGFNTEKQAEKYLNRALPNEEFAILYTLSGRAIRDAWRITSSKGGIRLQKRSARPDTMKALKDAVATTKAHPRWTDAEERFVVLAKDKGMPSAEIGKQINRSECAVNSKLHEIRRKATV